VSVRALARARAHPPHSPYTVVLSKKK